MPGGAVRIVSPASPADKSSVRRGLAELKRLGYRALISSARGKSEGYFASSLSQRTAELESALGDPDATAIICTRGGYGSAALLDHLRISQRARPKLVIGYSDITSLHIYLWQRLRWPSLYGPMIAAGLDCGAGKRKGYDRASFLEAVRGERQWSLALDGETIVPGEAAGVLLGGCLTLVQTSLGTSWELDTRGAILLLEDRAVKPYQLDRMLLHLKQAGKFRSVRGIILGDFPESGAVPRGGFTMGAVCRRLLGDLGVPVVFGAPVGHTARPMLTLPLGVRVHLHARGAGKLEISEPAVVPAN